MVATYAVAIDWIGDGDFADAGDDVSARVLDRSGGLTVAYGRDQARSLSPMRPGEASFELNNSSRDYSPENTSSPLAGMLLPARPVQMQATLAGTTYGLYRGFLDDFILDPDLEAASVHVTCLDVLGRLSGTQLSTALYSGITTGQAVNLILDAVGWPASARDIDNGYTQIPWWWAEGVDAAAALQTIVNSEGPPAFAFAGPDGKFVFRDRHHRIMRAPSVTPQATFRSTGAEPLFSPPTAYDQGWRDIINSVMFTVDIRAAADMAVVWSSDAAVTIANGATVAVAVQTTDPFTNAQVPAVGTDVIVTSGVVTVALSRTSGQSTTISLTASGGPAVVASVQLQAMSVRVVRSVQVSASDAASIAQYGMRTWPNDVGVAGVNDAAAVASVILAYRAQRLPIVEITLKSGQGNDTRLSQQLARNLSDRVTIVDPGLGLNRDFYIERIGHLVSGLSHTTVFGCEAAPAQVSNPFTFDVAGQGFDQGVFAVPGIDNPTNLLIFDAPFDTSAAALRVTDTFTRTVSSGLGSTDGGQLYTTSGGSGTDYNVASGVGTVLLGSVNVSRNAFLASVSLTDSDARLTFTVPAVATGAPLRAYLTAREQDSSNFYAYEIVFDLSGVISAVLLKRVGGVDTTFTSGSIPGGPYTAGQQWTVGGAIFGANLSLKVWPTGQTEPDWQLQWTDPSVSFTSGAPGFRLLAATGNTNASPTFSIDDFRVSIGGHGFDQGVFAT